jgi:Ca2+-binding RTX toxin-like protein
VTTSSSLNLTNLGQVEHSGIYVLDLQSSGLTTIKSITIQDDNIVSGGSGGASGFDLDFIKLSTVATTNPKSVGSLADLGAFDFTNGVAFHAGFMRDWETGDDAVWNTTHLYGTTVGNAYSAAFSTLAIRDGVPGPTNGQISFGEGGSITFTLTHAVSTAGLFLYLGDVGNGNDAAFVTVSDDAQPPTDPGGVTVVGAEGEDNSIILGVGNNSLLGPGDDTLIGSSGNDTIDGGGGNNYLRGGDGNDSIVGGAGFNNVNGNKGEDTIIGKSLVGDWLLGGQGNDLIDASASTGNNIINGNIGVDTIISGSGNDTVRGGQGADTISGGAGNDLIFGDLGNDTLSGGAGADTFWLTPGGGQDNITDFDGAAGDRIQITATGNHQVLNSGADTVILMDSGERFTLVGVTSFDVHWII